MAEFTKHSNYNAETGFASVVFGAHAPVLEVELNELQQIFNRKLELFFKYWGNSILPLSDDSGGISDGVITLKDCAVICDGKIIYVKESSIPLDSRYNFGYISVRVDKEIVVDCTCTLTCCGDVNGHVVENCIKDEREQIETSRRTVIPYELVFSEEALDDTETYKYVLVSIVTRNEETGVWEEERVNTNTLSELQGVIETQLTETRETITNLSQQVKENKRATEQSIKSLGETLSKDIETTAGDVKNLAEQVEQDKQNLNNTIQNGVSNLTSKIEETSKVAKSAYTLATTMCLIKHDDTGQLMRVGYNNEGLYVVPYELDEEPLPDDPSGDDPNEPLVMMLNFTDEEKDIKAEIDKVDRNVENATLNEAEVTGDNYLFSIN